MLGQGADTTVATAPPTAAVATGDGNLESMSFLVLYNGHNGEMTKIPKPIRYHSLNDLKRFILESFTNYLIEDIENIFLLTSFGIRLNFNIINEINELYIFDKRVFNLNQELIKHYYNLNLGNYNNLMIEYNQLCKQQVLPRTVYLITIREFTSNLKQFKIWSHNLLNNAIKMNDLITNQYLKQINNIFKSVKTIFEFLNNFMNDIEKSFNQHYNYIKLLNFKSLVSTWKQHYDAIKQFPPILIESENTKHKISLVNWLDYNELHSKAKFIETHLPIILNEFNSMINDINSINLEKLQIDQIIESNRNKSITNFKTNSNTLVLNEFTDLLADVDKELNSLSANEYDLNLSKMKELHSKNRSIHDKMLSLSDQINQNLSKTLSFKMELLSSNYDIYNKISNLQMKIVEIKNHLKVLSMPNSGQLSGIDGVQISHETVNNIKLAEDYLSLTIDLPLLFGFILIEKRRQFEWYDFYSKGIVNNITEQLTNIIDHEKLFQKLWLKKFGNFTKLLVSTMGNKSNQVGLKPVLPNLDVTLVGNVDRDNQLIFSMLQTLQIERQHIIDYIKSIEGFESRFGLSDKFSTVLNKNFKDLIKSTNNMKSVAKLITSMSNHTSPNEDLSNSKVKRIMEADNDEFNENLIKGLKSRIKKLEDLLHQQQFKNLSNWPVTRGYTSPRSTPPPTFSSAQTSHSQSKVPQIQTNSSQSPINQSPLVSPSSKNNPTQLLRKSSTSNTLDTSITIDKHLDNLRLKKENKELVDENDRLKQENFNANTRMEEMMKEIDRLKQENETQARRHETEVSQIGNVHNNNSHSKDEQIDDLRSQLSNNKAIVNEYKLINQSKDEKIGAYEVTVNEYIQEIKDLKNMKEDLMSNMTSKELEHIKSHNNLELEIDQLKLKLEEVTENYEDLIELTNNKQDLIHELNIIIIQLIGHIKRAVDANYEFFMEFVLVLESIGLLLIKEFNQESNQEEYKITRVKGLRSKKPDDTNGDISLLSVESHKPNTRVLEDIDQMMKWVENLLPDKINGYQENVINEVEAEDDVKSLSTNMNGEEAHEQAEDGDVAKSNELIELFNQNFKSENNNFVNFLKVISFRDEDHEKFFLPAISKRFRDVEGFAKKLTKENKVGVQELDRLTKSLKSKISVNNFKVSDMVLFLPTRIDNANDIKLNHQPWAAFNLGAPHYFLNTKETNISLTSKEWLVAKILSVKQYTVTDTNVNDREENPFQLSVGITWYLIDAKEETI